MPPPESGRQCAQNPTLYPRVMYRVLQQCGGDSIWKDDVYGRNQANFADQSNLPSALIDTHHARLVEVLLTKKKEPHVFANILYGYLRRGDFRHVVEILRTHPENQTSFEHEVLILHVIRAQAPDDVVLECAEYLAEAKETGYLAMLARNLWEADRHPLAERIIDECIPEHQRPLLRTWHAVAQRHNVSVDQVTTAITTLCDGISMESEESHQSWEICRQGGNLVNDFILALRQTRDWELLRHARELRTVQSDSGLLQPVFTSDVYDLDNAIIGHLIQNLDFRAAQEYCRNVHCGSNVHTRIAEAQIRHAHATNDRELAQDALTVLHEHEGETIRKLIEKHDAPHRENTESGLRWHEEVELHETTAQLHAEDALFALHFGNSAAAEQHIVCMIQAVDAACMSPDPECDSVSFRRSNIEQKLKSRFFESGFLHTLPEQGNWNKYSAAPKPQSIPAEGAPYMQYEKMKARERCTMEWNLSMTEEAIARGETDAQVQSLLESVQHYPNEIHWQKAVLLVEADPQAFAVIQPKFTAECLKGLDFRRREFDWKGMALFYAAANRTGALGERQCKELMDLLQKSRITHNGMETVDPEFVTTLIKTLIDGGDPQMAWTMYERIANMGNGAWMGEASMLGHTHQKCLSHFVRALHPQDATAEGIAASLRGEEPPPEDRGTAQIAYLNTQSEMLYGQGQPELAKLMEDQLVAQCTDVASVRTWTRLLALGSMRTSHQKKDILTAVYRNEGATERMRWRIVDALIEHDIPGAISLPEVNRRDTPPRIAKYFLRKLIAKKVLHPYASHFLTEDHLPHMRRLIAEFPNECNTVLQTIEKRNRLGDTLRSLRIAQDTDAMPEEFAPRDWEGIMITLRHLGICTPGIYAEARSKRFEPKALHTIGERVGAFRKQMSSSAPMQMDLATELQAEMIYAAYMPPNMDLGEVELLVTCVQDCSHHLDRFTFNANGYPLDLHGKKKMRMRTPGERLPSLETFHEVAYPITPTPHHEQEAAKALCNIGRLKDLENADWDGIMLLLRQDTLLDNCWRAARRCGRGDDAAYGTVVEFQEAFGIYLKDNLELIIRRFFEEHGEHTSKILKSFAESLRKPNIHVAIERQCQVEIDTSLPDAALAGRVIAVALLKKFNPLKELRRNIATDLTKFVAEEGERAGTTVPKLRAVISKNRAAFFGKASAGICTDTNVELFHREDHFHINIWDDERQVCVGNVQAYVMEHDGRPYLLLRGINPSTNLLKDVDPAAFCDAIIKIGIDFAQDNNLGGVILSEQTAHFVALSNRPEITTHLLRTYRSRTLALRPFPITQTATIQSGYLVWQNEQEDHAPDEETLEICRRYQSAGSQTQHTRMSVAA